MERVASDEPCQASLLGAGLHTLDDVAQWRREDLAALHGVGPRALDLIDAALAVTGRRYR